MTALRVTVRFLTSAPSSANMARGLSSLKIRGCTGFD